MKLKLKIIIFISILFTCLFFLTPKTYAASNYSIATQFTFSSDMNIEEGFTLIKPYILYENDTISTKDYTFQATSEGENRYHYSGTYPDGSTFSIHASIKVLEKTSGTYVEALKIEPYRQSIYIKGLKENKTANDCLLECWQNRFVTIKDPTYVVSTETTSRIYNHMTSFTISTGEVVKYIFETYASGISQGIIAKELTSRKVYVPGYWYYKNCNYNPDKYINYDNIKKYEWDGGMISAILSRQEYNGDLIVRKTNKPSFKLHKQVKSDMNEVLVFRKKFQPIVDDETIEKVRKRQSCRMRTLVSPELSKFKGMCYCKNCNHPLTFRKYNKQDYYLCHNDACDNKAFVKQDLLMKTIKQEVNELVRLFQEHKLKIMKYAENYIQNKKYVELKATPEEIKALETRNQKLDVLIGKLFESLMA